MNNDSFFFQVFRNKDLLKYVTNFNKSIRSLFAPEHETWLKEHPEMLKGKIKEIDAELSYAMLVDNIRYFDFIIKMYSEGRYVYSFWNNCLSQIIFRSGSLQIIQFICQFQNDEKHQHLKIIDWKPLKNNSAAIDYFAWCGRFDIIKWLHEHVFKNVFDGCTTKAMDWAAEKGNLEMVKWFHENRKEGCTERAMDWAAQNGHLEIVQWLHENREEGCTRDAIDWATTGGYLETVKWLSAHRPECR